MRYKILVVLCLQFILIQILHAEDRSGKTGFVFRENSSSSFGEVGFSFWTNNHFSLEPSFGFESRNFKGNSGTNLLLSFGGNYHFGTGVMLPYMTGRVGASILTGSSDIFYDLDISLGAGAEYFLTQWFSIGGEFLLKYIRTDPEFSPSGYPIDIDVLKTEKRLVIRFYLK